MFDLISRVSHFRLNFLRTSLIFYPFPHIFPLLFRVAPHLSPLLWLGERNPASYALWSNFFHSCLSLLKSDIKKLSRKKYVLRRKERAALFSAFQRVLFWRANWNKFYLLHWVLVSLVPMLELYILTVQVLAIVLAETKC